MSQYHRRDAIEDHIHATPDGGLTGGALAKPSKDRFGMHSHLYKCEGKVYETSPALNGGDHIHECEYGDTSGPMPVGKKPGDPWQDKAS